MDENASSAPVNPTDGLGGRYRIVAKIGRGGMADVYLALAQGPIGFAKLVVIKRLLRHHAEEASVREMFLDEARVAARLNHPNVIQTFEVGEHQGEYFLAMQYLEGQSLRRIVRALSDNNTWLSHKESAAIMVEVLKGLHYAHGMTDYDGQLVGLVHRDVSPPNIFITYEGAVKIVDFGIAKAAFRSTHTEAGIIKGKAAYMAPEQAMGENVDARTDVFSVGIVLWELVTKERLFDGPTSTASLLKLLKDEIQPPKELDPELSDELNDIIVKALQKSPANRYETAKDMRLALEHYVASKGGVDHERLGTLIASLFADERVRIQQRIQEAMKRTSLIPTDEPLAGVDSAGSLDAAIWGTGSTSSSRVRVVLPTENTATDVIPAAKVKSPLRYVLMAALSFAVVFLGLLVVRGTTSTETSAPPVSGSMIAAAPEVVPPPESTPTATASQPSATASAIPPVDNSEVAPKIARGTGRRWPKKIKEDTPKPPEPSTTVAAPVSTEMGYLTIDTSPWSHVSVGGQSLGATPVVRAPLKPGTYGVSLVNNEKGLRKGISVTIVAGKTTSRRVPLE